MVLRYESPDREEIRQLIAFHKQIQGMLAIMAHRKITPDPISTISGIFKCEGGVIVNKREICITDEYVYDDLASTHMPTKEEKAVVESINEILSNIDFTSVENAHDSAVKFMKSNFNDKELELLSQFMIKSIGDPLRSFFKV